MMGLSEALEKLADLWWRYSDWCIPPLGFGMMVFGVKVVAEPYRQFVVRNFPKFEPDVRAVTPRFKLIFLILFLSVYGYLRSKGKL
jgi:hypothetical protein